MTSYTLEANTPSKYDLSYDEGHPQRELTDFVVMRGDEKVSICALDDAQPSDRDIFARGSVTAHGTSVEVVTARLKEWCIEYGNPPRLWIRTEKVWYRLTKPAKEYSKIHEMARRRFELCSRIYILATSMDLKDCTYKLFVQLLSGPYGVMKGYTEKELLMEKGFILAQINNLSESLIAQTPFVKELKEKKNVPGKKSGSGGSRKKDSSTSANGSGASVSHKQWEPSGTLDSEGNVRLMKRVEKAVHQISKGKTAFPFNNPVDPDKDGCPDYLIRIKKPMDYGTIKGRLSKSFYETPLDVCKDMRQVATNCCEYNGELHDYSVWAVTLGRKFENLMRSAEEAEQAAMAKRVGNKKRKASDALPPSGKAMGRKPAPKVSRKNSKSSLELSPSGSPSKEDEPARFCARAKECKKMQAIGSKYCSDECGMKVARDRIEELNKAGCPVDEYIKACVTKALVHSRS